MELTWPTFRAASEATDPEWDPLTRDDLLFEDELLDVRLDAGRSTVSVIIDSGSRGFARVLVAHRVRAMHWSVLGQNVPRFGQRIARMIWTSNCRPVAGGLRLSLGVQGDLDFEARRASRISFRISAAEFTSYELHVEGMPEAPPDYGELDDAAIQAQRPDWDSTCRVVSWSRRTA
ncbi:hypothetical protein GCM10010531_22610 [Blastococcus jejuensis]|uniref:Uncharacterized protein n=1 Tax=Blastococcus jejuensis TaxID=351224 RepID=A0ABP6P8H3_9ACTN